MYVVLYPPIVTAAVCIPNPASCLIATGKAVCADQDDPFHSSVASLLLVPGSATPPKQSAAV